MSEGRQAPSSPLLMMYEKWTALMGGITKEASHCPRLSFLGSLSFTEGTIAFIVSVLVSSTYVCALVFFPFYFTSNRHFSGTPTSMDSLILG